MAEKQLSSLLRKAHPRHRLKLKMKKKMGYKRVFQRHVQLPNHHMLTKKRADFQGVALVQTKILAPKERLKARPSGLVSIRGLKLKCLWGLV